MTNDIDKLYTDLDPALRGMVWNKIGGITQEDLDEAVAHAWGEFAKYRPEGNRRQLLAWLGKAAYWKALKQIRTRERKPEALILDDPEHPGVHAETPQADPHEQAEVREELAEGMKRLDRLTDRQRRVWLRRNYLGQAPAEIAEAEGISDRIYRKEIEKANRLMAEE